MRVFPEFYYNMTDDKGNIVKDEKGEPIKQYNQLAYCKYFAENIQEYDESPNGKKIYEGISFAEFGATFGSNINDEVELLRFIVNMIISDRELEELQEKIIKNVIDNFCLFNFLALSTFVNVIIRARYYFLLEPTAEELAKEIKGNFKAVTFTKNDGKKVTYDSDEFITMLNNAIGNYKGESNNYECKKVVRIDDIANNEVLQSVFVVKMAQFLQRYFPYAKRRANCCMVSKLEQTLILKLLSFYGLAPKGVTLTDSRFRQLVATYNKSVHNEDIQVFGNGVAFHASFVSYSQWHYDKHWIEKEIKPPFSEKSTIQLNHSKEDAEKFSFKDFYKPSKQYI